MIRGGRSYVTSPPSFSNDAKKLLVCTGNNVSVFSAATGLQVTNFLPFSPPKWTVDSKVSSFFFRLLRLKVTQLQSRLLLSSLPRALLRRSSVTAGLRLSTVRFVTGTSQDLSFWKPLMPKFPFTLWYVRKLITLSLIISVWCKVCYFGFDSLCVMLKFITLDLSLCSCFCFFLGHSLSIEWASTTWFK